MYVCMCVCTCMRAPAVVKTQTGPNRKTHNFGGNDGSIGSNIVLVRIRFHNTLQLSPLICCSIFFAVVYFLPVQQVFVSRSHGVGV